MKTRKLTKIHGCLKYVQLYLFVLFLNGLAFNCMAEKVSHKIARFPTSVPEEEVLTLPRFDRPFLHSLFVEDDAGILASMRNDLTSWEDREQYAKNWNLKSTGLYNTPGTNDKKAMIMNRLLKYADKRFAGEMKNAEVGSALHTVGRVEKSLRPNTEVAISKLVSVKFRARVLQGKAIMDVQNPWLQFQATAKANGTVQVLSKKNFKEMGLSSGVEYTANNTEWVAYVDQEITDNIKARISSTQKNKSIFNNDADRKLEMNATFPINL